MSLIIWAGPYIFAVGSYYVLAIREAFLAITYFQFYRYIHFPGTFLSFEIKNILCIFNDHSIE